MKNKTITIYEYSCGPMRTISCSGNKYFLAMTTGQKQYVKVIFIKNMSNINGYFDKFLISFERHSGIKAGRIRIDSAPEFTQMKRKLG